MKFNEVAYLEANADVAASVELGFTISAKYHYEKCGMTEGRRLRNRTNPDYGRILIGGTGRAGTTLLVQIFTALGFNTGFEFDQAMASTDPVSNAGLEHLLATSAPLVVKSPWLVDSISSTLSLDEGRNSFALVPIRNIKDAAESRRRVGKIASERGDDPAAVAGGLWLTTDPAGQEMVLLEKFYETIYQFVRCEVRILFIEFPKFTRDENYLYDAFLDLWKIYGISREEVGRASNAVVSLGKINFG